MTELSLLDLVADALDDLKAQDIKVLSLAGKTDIADSMVIASGTSSRHIKALADHSCERAHLAGFGFGRIEGDAGSDWILVDFGPVIVHLFMPQARAYYDLEQLWGGARPSPSDHEG